MMNSSGSRQTFPSSAPQSECVKPRIFISHSAIVPPSNFRALSTFSYSLAAIVLIASIPMWLSRLPTKASSNRSGATDAASFLAATPRVSESVQNWRKLNWAPLAPSIVLTSENDRARLLTALMPSTTVA